MENNNQINIKHVSTLFRKRSRHWFRIYITIIFIFSIIYLLLDGFDNFIPYLIIVIVMFITGFVYKVSEEKLYLVDFISNSKNVEIRYFKKNVEIHLATDIDAIDIRLKNISTRFGFDCKIILNAAGLKFIITKDFDWSMQEMKKLFKFVKDSKHETFTFKDKFNLKQIDKKIMNN